VERKFEEEGRSGRQGPGKKGQIDETFRFLLIFIQLPESVQPEEGNHQG
jgi:hypothetical protein